jgi:predicted nucleotidyltransferase
MRIRPGQHQRIADICRRYGVRRLQMFGSAARGEEGPASDIDLLVEFDPGHIPTGFALVDLRDALSVVFDGRDVDLAFPSVLDNPFRRRAIEPELRPLFQ